MYEQMLNRLFCAELLQEGASALLLETGSRVDCLSADASTGMLYLCDSLRSKTHIYTYDTAAGTPGECRTAQPAAGRVTALDGKLFFDNGVFTADGECLRMLRETTASSYHMFFSFQNQNFFFSLGLTTRW